MREGRGAHAGVMSGVGIRQAFDPDHIRHHPDVARPPPPSISTPHQQQREGVGEARRRWSGFEEPGAMARRLDPAYPMAAYRMSYAPLSLLVAVVIPPLPPTPSRPTRPDPRRAASALGREEAMT